MACRLAVVSARCVRSVAHNRHRQPWPAKWKQIGHAKSVGHRFPTDQRMSWPGAFGEYSHRAYAELLPKHLYPNDPDAVG